MKDKAKRAVHSSWDFESEDSSDGSDSDDEEQPLTEMPLCGWKKFNNKPALW